MRKKYNFSVSKKNPYVRLLNKQVTIRVYINQEQMNLLKLEAKKENVTVSKLIREAIKNLLAKKSKKINWDNDQFTKAISTIWLDVPDASTRTAPSQTTSSPKISKPPRNPEQVWKLY